MIYWFFTDGREMLAGLLMPLLCLAPVLLPLTAAIMGAGIRRTSEEQTKPTLVQRMLLIASYTVALLTVTTLYLSLLGGQAVQRGRSNASS